MFAFQEQRGAVEVAFTDRFGGVSTGPYAELNLKVPDHLVPDTPEERAERAAVTENLARVAGALGGPEPQGGVVTMRQVHGADVAFVGPSLSGPEPEADALVTAVPGPVLASRAADCVPVLLADPGRALVAAVHAGRNGVLLGVVPAAVAALHDLGAAELVAWVGPHACGRCYEVPGALRDEVAAVVPETRSETSWGTPALDLGAGVAAQLRAAGADVVELGRCTIEDTDFFSYRRQGAESGRHAGLVRIRP